MKNTRMVRFAIASLVTCVPSAAFAQTVVVTYVLDDVWLLPDISHPWEAAQQMTGTLRWTYQEGDFENGSGEFVDLYLPWYGDDLGGLNVTIETTAFEFSLAGNFHDLGVGLTLFLLGPISPDQSAMIDPDRSLFDIERGISHKGHVISGSIVPTVTSCPGDLDGDGRSDLADFLFFDDCVGEPGQPVAPGCNPADFNGDSTVEIVDFAAFQVAFGCS